MKVGSCMFTPTPQREKENANVNKRKMPRKQNQKKRNGKKQKFRKKKIMKRKREETNLVPPPSKRSPRGRMVGKGAPECVDAVEVLSADELEGSKEKTDKHLTNFSFDHFE